jgi:hypothetical protein
MNCERRTSNHLEAATESDRRHNGPQQCSLAPAKNDKIPLDKWFKTIQKGAYGAGSRKFLM